MNFYYIKENELPTTQVDIQHVRNATMNGAEEILPEHLVNTAFCIVKDCPVPEYLPWQTCEESFELDQDGKYQRTLVVVDLPEPTRSVVAFKSYDTAITAMLNSIAASYGYDDHKSMISYAGDMNPKFDLEGRSMKAYRSIIWTTANQMSEDYANSNDLEAPLPIPADVVASLPQFELLVEED